MSFSQESENTPPSEDDPTSPVSADLSSDTRPVSEWKKSEPLHAATASLHGWAIHAHNTGEELKLSKSDYDAAIKAASSRVNGKYQPHAPANCKKVK